MQPQVFEHQFKRTEDEIYRFIGAMVGNNWIISNSLPKMGESFIDGKKEANSSAGGLN